MKWPEDFIGKVIQGDCLDVMRQMPDKCVDLVITDPPYGMNYHSNHYKYGNPHTKIKGDDAFPLDSLKEMKRISKRAVYTFCRWDNLSEIPKPKSFIVWAKNNHTAGDLKHEYGRSWEGCAFYPQEDHKFTIRPWDVIDTRRVPPTKLNHPTEKPIPLMSKLITDNVGEIVFDPYCGSGTTLVAAQAAGRKFSGIEIDKKYCEIARKRIAAEQEQGKLF